MKMTAKPFLLLAILLGAFACSAAAGEPEGRRLRPPLPPKKWHCQCLDRSSTRGAVVVAAAEREAVDMGLAPDLNLTLVGKEWEKKLPWPKWIPKCGCKPFEAIGPGGKGLAPADLGIDVVIAVPSPPPEKTAGSGN